MEILVRKQVVSLLLAGAAMTISACGSQDQFGTSTSKMHLAEEEDHESNHQNQLIAMLDKKAIFRSGDGMSTTTYELSYDKARNHIHLAYYNVGMSEYFYFNLNNDTVDKAHSHGNWPRIAGLFVGSPRYRYELSRLVKRLEEESQWQGDLKIKEKMIQFIKEHMATKSKNQALAFFAAGQKEFSLSQTDSTKIFLVSGNTSGLAIEVTNDGQPLYTIKMGNNYVLLQRADGKTHRYRPQGSKFKPVMNWFLRELESKQQELSGDEESLKHLVDFCHRMIQSSEVMNYLRKH